MKNALRRNTMRNAWLLLLLGILLMSFAAEPAYSGSGDAQVRVTFDADGGTPVPEVQTLLQYEPAAEPKAPQKKGYDFDGWYDEDGWIWDFNDPVIRDMVLTAGYTPWTVFVTAVAWCPVTSDTLEGVELTWSYSDPFYEMTEVTTASGEILFPVWYGSEVRIEQTKAPEDYIHAGTGPYLCRMNEDKQLEIKDLGVSGDWIECPSETIYFNNFKQWPITLDNVSKEDPNTTLAGAEIEIIDAYGNTLFKKISGKPGFSDNILLAEHVEYLLRVNAAPAGYAEPGDVHFMLNDGGKIMVISGEEQVNVKNPVPPEVWAPKMTVVNKKTSAASGLYELNMRTVRKLTGQYLAGAVIEYYDKADPSTVKELTTMGGPFPVQLQRGAVYHFKAKTSPDGYECVGDNALECTLNDEGNFLVRKTWTGAKWVRTDPKEMTFFYHKKFAIDLSKVAEDAPDKEQKGARLQLGWSGFQDFFVGNSGEPTFPKTVYLLEGIPYTFSELNAPSGYSKHEDIVFVIDKDKKIVIQSGEALIKNDDPGHTIPKLVMVNKKAAAAKPSESTKPPEGTKPPGGTKPADGKTQPESTKPSGGTKPADSKTQPESTKPADGKAQPESTKPSDGKTQPESEGSGKLLSTGGYIRLALILGSVLLLVGAIVLIVFYWKKKKS